MDGNGGIMENIEKERIAELRKLLEYYNYLYYVKNAPRISDMEFDKYMHELEALEDKHPEWYDPNSPTCNAWETIPRMSLCRYRIDTV